jgi:hypothetical protein
MEPLSYLLNELLSYLSVSDFCTDLAKWPGQSVNVYLVQSLNRVINF